MQYVKVTQEIPKKKVPKAFVVTEAMKTTVLGLATTKEAAGFSADQAKTALKLNESQGKQVIAAMEKDGTIETWAKRYQQLYPSVEE